MNTPHEPYLVNIAECRIEDPDGHDCAEHDEPFSSLAPAVEYAVVRSAGGSFTAVYSVDVATGDAQRLLAEYWDGAALTAEPEPEILALAHPVPTRPLDETPPTGHAPYRVHSLRPGLTADGHPHPEDRRPFRSKAAATTFAAVQARRFGLDARVLAIAPGGAVIRTVSALAAVPPAPTASGS
ncbi:hypothetical protein GCM10022221_67610 [Actinocorallia aurea]